MGPPLSPLEPVGLRDHLPRKGEGLLQGISAWRGYSGSWKFYNLAKSVEFQVGKKKTVAGTFVGPLVLFGGFFFRSGFRLGGRIGGPMGAPVLSGKGPPPNVPRQLMPSHRYVAVGFTATPARGGGGGLWALFIDLLRTPNQTLKPGRPWKKRGAGLDVAWAAKKTGKAEKGFVPAGFGCFPPGPGRSKKFFFFPGIFFLFFFFPWGGNRSHWQDFFFPLGGGSFGCGGCLAYWERLANVRALLSLNNIRGTEKI